MPITTGGFDDLVQLSQDTLYYLGADFVAGNSVAGSTISHGFVNTAGSLVLAAAPTGNDTVWLPNTNGTLLVGINVSAGTTSNNLSAVTFSTSPQSHIMTSSIWVPRSPKPPKPAILGSAIHRQFSHGASGFASNQPPSEPLWQLDPEMRVIFPNTPRPTCSLRNQICGLVRMK